jgi:hypothetical protein
VNWAEINWCLSTTAIAEETGRPAYYVSSMRRKHAPHTLAPQTPHGNYRQRVWLGLSEAQKRWVEDEAARHNCTQQEVIRNAINTAIKHVSK